MIVVEHDDYLTLFQQYHHSLLSGVFAKQWAVDYRCNKFEHENIQQAVALHDRSWVPLDQHPKWNEAESRPYSFIDFPEEDKVKAYREGIDQMEESSSYAAILCSLHYVSFYSNDKTHSGIVMEFLQHEKIRRKRLSSYLRETPDWEEHLRFLQFCDDLSLYCCMNQPGVNKNEELSWFRNGFPQYFSFAPNGIKARWLDQTTIEVAPFPFEDSFTTSIPYKQDRYPVIKKDLEEQFNNLPWKERVLTFVPPKD